MQKGNGYFQVPPHTPVIFGEAGGRTLFRYRSGGLETLPKKSSHLLRSTESNVVTCSRGVRDLEAFPSP